MTEFTLFLVITSALFISFMAKIFEDFLCCTFHTFPNPPIPITYYKLNMFLMVYWAFVSVAIGPKNSVLKGSTVKRRERDILLGIFRDITTLLAVTGRPLSLGLISWVQLTLSEGTWHHSLILVGTQHPLSKIDLDNLRSGGRDTAVLYKTQLTEQCKLFPISFLHGWGWEFRIVTRVGLGLLLREGGDLLGVNETLHELLLVLVCCN